jgi:hypothetical protein
VTQGDVSAQEHRGVWRGTIDLRAQAADSAMVVSLGSQSLSWPLVEGIAPGDPVDVLLEIDDQDTARRRDEAEKLISDLFG